MAKEADFHILMIGPRRVGKSSVLSAMLKSIERLGLQTGFSFEADSDTKSIMRSRLSDLEMLYVLHAKEPEIPFSTLLGEEEGQKYSGMTGDSACYRFELNFAGKKQKNTYTVEFTDIPGEYMENQLQGEGNTVIDRFMKSNVVVVAVDSPALMEGREKGGVGEFHRMVNIPDSVYNVISVSDCRIREQLKEKQKMGPKMILFVPLKCEKYYHEGTMGELNRRVKIGYQSTFSFLEVCPEYTIAITPILTLGDIVFDHYGVKANAKGKEKVVMLDGSGAGGLSNMPAYPMYRLRSPECTAINPQYCEQPMLYLAGYIMGMKNYLKKAEKAAKGNTKESTIVGKIGNAVKHVVLFYLFGVFYLTFLGVSKVLRNRPMMESIGKLCQNIKISGEGYEIVQDNLGIGDVVKAYAAKD